MSGLQFWGSPEVSSGGVLKRNFINPKTAGVFTNPIPVVGCKGVTVVTNDNVQPTLDVTWTDDSTQDGCPVFVKLDPLTLKEIRGASNNVTQIWWDQ